MKNRLREVAERCLRLFFTPMNILTVTAVTFTFASVSLAAGIPLYQVMLTLMATYISGSCIIFLECWAVESFIRWRNKPATILTPGLIPEQEELVNRSMVEVRRQMEEQFKKVKKEDLPKNRQTQRRMLDYSWYRFKYLASKGFIQAAILFSGLVLSLTPLGAKRPDESVIGVLLLGAGLTLLTFVLWDARRIALRKWKKWQKLEYVYLDTTNPEEATFTEDAFEELLRQTYQFSREQVQEVMPATLVRRNGH